MALYKTVTSKVEIALGGFPLLLHYKIEEKNIGAGSLWPKT
jgi:hypothetical protein